MPLHVSAYNGDLKVNWYKVKGLWVSAYNGDFEVKWYKVPMERKLLNWSFPTLKSDTTKDHASGIWNNDSDARTGSYGGYNYQGFMMGRPTKDSDGNAISGSGMNVTYVRLTLQRNPGSGYPPGSNTSITIHSCPIWSGAPSKTPPTIPYNLSAYKCRLSPPPAIGASKTYTITDAASLQMFTEWLNTNRYLCFWDPGDTAAYSGYTRVTIDEMRFT